MTALDLAGIDRELARFRGAADVISVNLLELDADPNRQLLDTAPLSGVTGAAWTDARSALTSVWDWFARFTTFLEQADGLRGSPRTRPASNRERQLVAFLTEPSIELPRDDVPLRHRDLLQPRQATNRCTADELLAVMTDAFARARDVVVRVATAWDDLVPRVAAARARTVGLAASPQVHAIDRRLDELSDALVVDPLAVTSEEIAAVEADIDAIALDAHAHEQLRRDVLARIRDTHERIEAVTQTAIDAQRACETARAKIGVPEIVGPPVVGTTLADAINNVADRADAGHWREANRDLDRIAADLDALELEIARSAQASRATLAERDHLRGRLDAYRAKAHGLGLDEDDEVSAAYGQALDALHVAPADLVLASDLVAEYQRLLSPTPQPEARR
jgi:hypothetical protein